MAIDNIIFQSLLGNERKPKSSLKIFNDVIDLNTDKTTGHKPSTNRTQTKHVTGHKLNTNRAQTGHNTKILKNENSPTGHKPDTKPNTTLDTNQAQTEYKPDTNTSFSQLVGLQRRVLIFLFHDCKLSRARHTQELTLLHIAESLEIAIGSVKTTLKRLEEKWFIKRIGYKNGRGGWFKFEISDDVYRSLIHMNIEHKPNTNRTQTGYKVDTKVDTQLNTSPLSSSSSYNKTTTTEVVTDLVDEWQTVDIDPLKDIGFTTTHLAQIARQGKLSTEIVQDSIHAFAFDIKYNKKGATLKGNPLNFFMGILRNGAPYAPPGNYESPQDREMRIYLERKREIENARAAREEELIKLAFAEWEKEQSEESKNALLPEDTRISKLLGPKQAALRTYFAKEIWPQKRKDLQNTFKEEVLSNKKAELI